MTRGRALAVFGAALVLLGMLNVVVYSQYRTERATVERALDDRLMALGGTAARWLAAIPDGHDALLATLVTENRLEDAYILDRTMRVTAGVHTPPDQPLNLLRIDDERLVAALAGKASVGAGYSIANARVDAAYVPFAGHVLALEAGADYLAPAARVRTTYLVAVALTVLVAALFAFGLGLALRAFERARIAHGQAERLAAVGQMAAMVAHEVRNPLGILRGQVELAREKLAAVAAPREQQRFTEMLDEIERLNRLTEEFLALARDAPVERARVDLAALAAEIAAAVQLAVGDAAIELAIPEGLAIEADAHKLRQALYNLVLNALQVGGPGTHVRIEAAATATGVRLTVADDGPGVPAELVATLFEPFVTARPGGSGLGLAVARRIAERHRGTLVLEPAGGTRGARFTMTLPHPPGT